MFLSSALTLLKIKPWILQNSQFCYSPVVIKKYTSNSSKISYLFCSCSNQITFFAKVFDIRHRKSSNIWVIFLQNLNYLDTGEILLQ